MVCRADAELGHRRFPTAVEIGAEDQRIVGADAEPAGALNFVVELARPPAGVTERQQAALRSVALGDRLENVDRHGQRHFFVDHYSLRTLAGTRFGPAADRRAVP